jgi:elongator complex protein 2
VLPLGSGEFSVELLNAFEASLENMADEEGGRQISTKRHVLAVKEGERLVFQAQGNNRVEVFCSLRQFQVEFDALLIGHEASVTSLSWRPGRSPSATPMLLSTSVDSSVILWAPESFRTGVIEKDATLWVNKQRFGDVGGQRLGGFVGGMWAVGGNDVMAWGWNGGWRRWRSSMGEPETWMEVPASTGHAGPVHGLDWSPNGDYLITAR